MPDKKFIGKVFEKQFSNGGSIIKFTLSPEEKRKLYDIDGPTTIEIKKGMKGNYYAEISQFQNQNQ